MPLRLLIVTDAWHPSVNGVVRTLEALREMLRAQGDEVEIIGPDRFRTLPAPGYPEIRLALAPHQRLKAIIAEYAPNAVHIVTEGPLGWAARAICRARGWPFTTAFHTRFPEYVQVRTGAPTTWTWAVLRRFHAAGAGCFAATASLRTELAARGFPKVLPWTRGVDLSRFRPGGTDAFSGLPRPIFLYAGRIAVEKSIEAFLCLDLPGSKVVVGEGPHRAVLMGRFPEVHFTGWRDNGALTQSYASADVFVFPSRTDTFGLVLLEALACGTPVAAYPVAGPLDVAAPPEAGVLDENLRTACLRALGCCRAAARAHAARFSWAACAAEFRRAVVRVDGAAAPRRASASLALLW